MAHIEEKILAYEKERRQARDKVGNTHARPGDARAPLRLPPAKGEVSAMPLAR